MSTTRLLLVVCGALTAAGCSSWNPVSVENGGDLCVGADGFMLDPNEDVQLQSDTATTWSWKADTCLSSSCSRNVVPSCTVTVAGSAVTVTSSATWEELRGLYVACTLDCVFVTATCAFPALPAGTYTLKHGARETPLTVPSTVKRCLLP